MSDTQRGKPWSDQENDLIVTDYFEMLRMDALGERFNKRERNKALHKLIGRSHGSIEFKHRNISAVLQELGVPWLRGYAPLANYQGSLVDGINRYLTARGEASITQDPIRQEEDEQLLVVAEESELYVDHGPPSLQPANEERHRAMQRLVRKFDPATRDAQNRKLGEMGEERILRFEHARLTELGRPDLARKVKWVSKEEGDGAGYDVLSFTEKGRERLLEVKTTRGTRTTPFYLTENERLLSTERPKEFRIVRLYDFPSTESRLFRIAPPLEKAVLLSPTNYRASFGP